MQEVKSPHPPGVIIVTSGDLARYVDFAVSLNQMRVPCGSTLAWTCGADISLNRNMGIEKLLAEQGTVLVYADRSEHDETARAVRAALDGSAYEAALAAGRKLTLDAAVAKALELAEKLEFAEVR